MRLLLSTDLVGGVWDHTRTLVGELAGRGCEVRVAAIGEPGDPRLRDLAPGVDVVARPFRLEWMADAWADVEASAAWLAEQASAWGADVVHQNQLALASHPSPAPVLVAAHSDVLSWFSETLGHAAPAEWSEYRDRVARSLDAADLRVAPSRYQSDLIGRHFGRAADRVISNGAAAAVGAPPRADAADLPPTVLAVGRAWDAAKGAATLDAALERLGPDAPDAVLLGDTRGPDGEQFVPTRLRALGRVGPEVLADWYARSALYVGASRYEPFGLAPLEAALAGCPLLLADIGSFRELWDGVAEFFPAGDADALAEGIRRLLAAPDRRAELGRRARARAAERFTPRRMADGYLLAYRALLGAPTPIAA